MKNPIYVDDLRGTHLINNLAPFSSQHDSLSHHNRAIFVLPHLSNVLRGVSWEWPLDHWNQLMWLLHLSHSMQIHSWTHYFWEATSHDLIAALCSTAPQKLKTHRMALMCVTVCWHRSRNLFWHLSLPRTKSSLFLITWVPECEWRVVVNQPPTHCFIVLLGKLLLSHMTHEKHFHCLRSLRNHFSFPSECEGKSIFPASNMVISLRFIKRLPEQQFGEETVLYYF